MERSDASINFGIQRRSRLLLVPYVPSRGAPRCPEFRSIVLPPVALSTTFQPPMPMRSDTNCDSSVVIATRLVVIDTMG
jgi:hypothetical protein